MIILGMSKWSFQWITNFLNYIINIQSYQNTNKITFHSNSFLFACFSIALGCCKCATMRFHCATVLVVLSICALRGNIADDAMQMDDKSLYLFCTINEMPHVTVTITKNALLAAIASYISITTIYTVGYLQIFNTGHFFSSRHCHDLERKKHWISMVFNENTNYDFILLSKQGRTPLKYEAVLTTEHFFENFWGGLPGCSSASCGNSQQDL